MLLGQGQPQQVCRQEHEVHLAGVHVRAILSRGAARLLEPRQSSVLLSGLVWSTA